MKEWYFNKNLHCFYRPQKGSMMNIFWSYETIVNFCWIFLSLLNFTGAKNKVNRFWKYQALWTKWRIIYAKLWYGYVLNRLSKKDPQQKKTHCTVVILLRVHGSIAVYSLQGQTISAFSLHSFLQYSRRKKFF